MSTDRFSICKRLRWVPDERPASSTPMARFHEHAYRRLARLHQCDLLGWHRDHVPDHALDIQQVWPQVGHIHGLRLPCTGSWALRCKQRDWFHPVPVLRGMCVCLLCGHGAAAHQRNCVSYSPWYCERIVHVWVVRWRHHCCFHRKWIILALFLKIPS